MFEVIDTGIGIDKSKQDEVFNVFTQAGKDISRNFGGTGLGLAISKKITDLMNGELTVESVKGSGSTFSLRVTLKTSQRRLDFKEKRGGNPDCLKGQHILLALDKDDHKALNPKLFSQYRARVCFASNKTELQKQTQKAHFDLCLIDVNLEGFQNLITPETLREELTTLSSTDMVAVTSTQDHLVTQELKELGFKDVLTKPYHLNDLLICICENVH